MELTQHEIATRGEIEVCCEGCNRVTPNLRCNTYLNPQDKWGYGGCAMASHTVRVEKTRHGKVRVGQQKQRKR